MKAPIIYVNDVSVKINNRLVLDSVSLEVEKPTFLLVVGPNGAGKTTLLKMLLGVTKPFKGEVRVLGLNPFKDKVGVRRFIGYVPQKDKISYDIPLTAGEVVLMGLLLKKGIPRNISRSDIEVAKRTLAYLGIEDKWDCFFSELSGGQQRRILIARALVSNPSLLLLDEVFAGLDQESQERLLEILKTFKDHGKTIIAVEHELDPVISLADKILVLNRSVYAYGEIDVVLNEEKLKYIYPHLKSIEKNGRRIIILGDRHA